MIAAVKRGDRVVTGGGILGTVQRVPMVQDKDGKQVPSQEIEVEIAKDMRVTVLRDTITSVIKAGRRERHQAGEGQGVLTTCGVADGPRTAGLADAPGSRAPDSA